MRKPIKSLFQNIGLAVLLNLLIKSVWILVNNVVQDRIGHADFGTYTALYSVGFLFIALSDLGVNQYSTKTLAKDKGLLKKLLPNLFGFKLLLSILYPFLMLGAGWLLGYEGTELYYLFILCLMQAMVQMFSFFRANFQAFQKFRLDAFASVLDRALLLIIIGYLLATKISLESYIFAAFISVGITMIVLYFTLVKAIGWVVPRINAKKIRELVKGTFPFAIITILYSVHDKVDQVMLERLLEEEKGDVETGLYAGAYRWVDAVSMYLWTVLPIFFAKFAYHIRSFKAQTKLLQFGQSIAAVPLIFISVFVFFYGDKLLFLFTHSNPDDLATMESAMKILFVAVAINGFFAIYSTLLTSTNHERFVSWMVFVSILINITLNFIFIPLHGAVASAYTTVVSYAFLSISYLIYIQFRLKVKIPWLTLVKLLGIGGVFAGIFFGLSLTPLPWWLVSGISGVILLGMTWFAGLIKPNQELELED